MNKFRFIGLTVLLGILGGQLRADDSAGRSDAERQGQYLERVSKEMRDTHQRPGESRAAVTQAPEVTDITGKVTRKACPCRA